jgi:class 3 adenylate cyclase
LFGIVLFTDIVDSTRRPAEVGDEKWSEVLHDHDRITRRPVEDGNGRVVKSTGDVSLVLFPMPSDGVTCAEEMRSQLAGAGCEYPRRLHAGEVQLHDDGDISGVTINVAARLEQAVADGAVRVPSTVWRLDARRNAGACVTGYITPILRPRSVVFRLSLR